MTFAPTLAGNAAPELIRIVFRTVTAVLVGDSPVDSREIRFSRNAIATAAAVVVVVQRSREI